VVTEGIDLLNVKDILIDAVSLTIVVVIIFAALNLF